MNLNPYLASIVLMVNALFLSGCCSRANPEALTSAPVMGKTSLRATFLGCTTVLLDDGETAILTDGFFSRPCEIESVRRPIKPNREVIDQMLARAGIKKLAAVLVAHSHHDHALDSAYVAEKTDADLIGSKSTRYIANGQGFPCSRFHVPKNGDTFEYKRFKITIIESPHSSHALFPGDIEKPLHSPAWIGQYHPGINYNFLIDHDGEKIAIIPSAGLISDRLKGQTANVVFLGIGTLGMQTDAEISAYWKDTVTTMHAQLVIPTHWDNFFRPLSDPLQPMPWPIDDFKHTRKKIACLAAKENATVEWAKPFATLYLPASQAEKPVVSESGKPLAK